MSGKRRFTKPVTAEDLIGQLEQDPTYVQMLREKEEQCARNRAEFEEQEKPVLEDLRRVGIFVPSVGKSEYFESYVPFSAEAVEVFVRWVPNAPARVQECLVRLLGAVTVPFDGRVLTALFDQTESNHLRWVIANTLELAKPLMVADWLKNRLMNSEPINAIRPLFKALTLISDRASVLEVARRRLDVIPDAASQVLAKYGNAEDIPLLQRMVSREEHAVQRKLKSAIAKIQKREGGLVPPFREVPPMNGT